jgi:hypothetical protein
VLPVLECDVRCVALLTVDASCDTVPRAQGVAGRTETVIMLWSHTLYLYSYST